MVCGVVVAALQVVEAGFAVADIAAVGQRIPERDCGAGGAVDDIVAAGVDEADKVAPCVIGVCCHHCAVSLDDLYNVTLQIEDVVVGRKAAAAGVAAAEEVPIGRGRCALALWGAFGLPHRLPRRSSQ